MPVHAPRCDLKRLHAAARDPILSPAPHASYASHTSHQSHPSHVSYPSHQSHPAQLAVQHFDLVSPERTIAVKRFAIKRVYAHACGPLVRHQPILVSRDVVEL